MEKCCNMCFYHNGLYNYSLCLVYTYIELQYARYVGYVLVSERSITLYYLIYEHFFSFLWV
jgi:hypothetical protein